MFLSSPGDEYRSKITHAHTVRPPCHKFFCVIICLNVAYTTREARPAKEELAIMPSGGKTFDIAIRRENRT